MSRRPVRVKCDRHHRQRLILKGYYLARSGGDRSLKVWSEIFLNTGSAVFEYRAAYDWLGVDACAAGKLAKIRARVLSDETQLHPDKYCGDCDRRCEASIRVRRREKPGHSAGR